MDGMKLKSTAFSMGLICTALMQPSMAAHIVKVGSHNRERIVVPDATDNSNIVPFVQQGINTLISLGGGTLVLAAGQYNIGNYNKAIQIYDASGIIIRGDGNGTYIKQAANTLAANFFHVQNSTGITFENIRFEGLQLSNVNGDSQYETAIQTDGTSREIRVRACSFKYFKSGAIRLMGTPSQARISGNVFNGVDNALNSVSYFGAIDIANGKDILIQDNQFSDLRHAAIFLRKCESVTVSGNGATFSLTSYHSQSSGVYVLDGVRKSVFSGNQFTNPVHGFNLQSASATGIALEDNIISKNVIQARYSGVNLNFTATCSGAFLSSARNSINGNSISGVWSGSAWDEVDHAIFSQLASLTLISGNVVRKSLVGVNFQQCTQENQVLDNQIESSSNGINFNGTGIVSKNFVRGAATGISADWSTYTAITDNALSNTTTRLNVHPSRVYTRTISNNCDMAGACN
jgi:hypothetical protein